MKSKFLFPQWTKAVGYTMAISGLIMGYLFCFYQYEIPNFGFYHNCRWFSNFDSYEDLTNEFATILSILGLLFIAFAKEKKEDELISKLRQNALQWGVYGYYAIFFVYNLMLFVFKISIYDTPIVFVHFLTPLILFIGRFIYLKLNKNNFIIKPLKYFPNSVKLFGLLLTAICLLILIFLTIKNQYFEGRLFFAIYPLFILGLFLLSFSKYKTEDEMAIQLRLESLQLATYFNYVLLILATLILYSFRYLYYLNFAQTSLLIFYVLRMEYQNSKIKKSLKTRKKRIES